MTAARRRPRLVAGNWKMNRTAQEGAALAAELKNLLAATGGSEVALCPPFTALEAVGRVIAGTTLKLGAQNLHGETHGAFTGEISGAMLKALGCTYVIVGHSERRHGMGETDEVVAKKLRAAQRDGLIPIVCVGELLAEREKDMTADVLVRQIHGAYEGLAREAAVKTVVAYEPVWAIGTGKVATPEQARDAHRIVRATLDRVAGAGVGEGMRILYGGSVNAANAPATFAQEDVDGALVGGASLEAASFFRIAAAAV